MVDPMPIYEKAARPKKLTDADAINDKMRRIYKEELSIYVKNRGYLRMNIHKVYTLVWGQYSSTLHSMIKHLEDYDEKLQDFGVPWLLN
eukprot:1230791-Ditylum_brightwellii.AAC.1